MNSEKTVNLDYNRCICIRAADARLGVEQKVIIATWLQGGLFDEVQVLFIIVILPIV